MVAERDPSCAPAAQRRGRRRRPLPGFGDEGGATAVEFAIIAPVFLLLVFVIAEVALLFVAGELMDRAVTATARLVRTGQVQIAKMNKKAFRDEICSNTLALIDCNSKYFYLDVESYNDFASMDATPPINKAGKFKGNGKADFGGPNDIVVVRVYYEWPTSPILGEWTLANLANGRRLLGAMAAFRNEPFPPVAKGNSGKGSSGSGSSGNGSSGSGSSGGNGSSGAGAAKKAAL